MHFHNGQIEEGKTRWEGEDRLRLGRWESVKT
jgi:hypothetical protein